MYVLVQHSDNEVIAGTLHVLLCVYMICRPMCVCTFVCEQRAFVRDARSVHP